MPCQFLGAKEKPVVLHGSLAKLTNQYVGVGTNFMT